MLMLLAMVSTVADATWTPPPPPPPPPEPITFVATAYTRDCKGCSGYTSWKGLVANPHGPVKMMAVDPKVLHLGTCYRLQFGDGQEDIYLAADTGGDIKHHRLDLLWKTKSSARKFGKQHVKLIGEADCPVNPHTLPRHTRG